MAYLDEILVFSSTVNNINLPYHWQALLLFAKIETSIWENIVESQE